MQTLTREQAIKRIRDIIELKSIDHIEKAAALAPKTGILGHHILMTTSMMVGAKLELMAIFDIKEEEL